MPPASGDVNWVYLNRYAYLAVSDQRVVAIAYWTPDTLGEQVEDDDPTGSGQPMIVEAGYFLVSVDDARGIGFATGPEPTGEWPDDLLGEAELRLREWD